MLVMVMLLVFAGCKDNEETSLDEQNRSVENINGEGAEVQAVQNETIKESVNEEVGVLTNNENEIVYENEKVIVYEAMTDTEYKDIIDSPYGGMNVTIKWNLSNYYSEDDYGEIIINKDVNRITTILKKDINNSVVWMNNHVLLIDGRLLYDIETREKVELYSNDETNQLLDYSINADIGQCVLLIKNGQNLSIIVIDIEQQFKVNTYNFSISNALEQIRYAIAYIDDENVIFNGYDDSGYPSIIKLDLVTGKNEQYSDDLMLESEYFTTDKHVIIFNDLTKLLLLNISENGRIEEAVTIMSNKWYLKKDGITYINNNKCYEFTYDNNESKELFDLKELNIDSEKYNGVLEFCMKHDRLGIFYQTSTNEDLEEDYVDINGINYILEVK